MLHLSLKLNSKQPFIIACSGGVDSMAAVDFLHRGGKNFKVAYFNHRTLCSDHFLSRIEWWCKRNNRELLIGHLNSERPKGTSLEEHWRNERYAFLRSFKTPIITCHHLNDAMETWIFGSIHGKPKLIPIVNEDVIRPFLLNPKGAMIDWCKQHGLSWYEDPSNADTHFPRNRIRHNILPEYLKVNPGFVKVIKKKVLAQMKELGA